MPQLYPPNPLRAYAELLLEAVSHLGDLVLAADKGDEGGFATAYRAVHRTFARLTVEPVLRKRSISEIKAAGGAAVPPPVVPVWEGRRAFMDRLQGPLVRFRGHEGPSYSVIVENLIGSIVERLGADAFAAQAGGPSPLDVVRGLGLRPADVKSLYSCLAAEFNDYLRATDAQAEPKPTRAKRRGRYKTAHDPEADARLLADWRAARAAGVSAIAAFAQERGLPEGDVRAALERARKREAAIARAENGCQEKS